MINKLFNSYRQESNEDFISSLWKEIKNYSDATVSKAFKLIISEEKFLPSISIIKEYCRTEERNSRKLLSQDISQPYYLTDLEMLWFKLNAQYCGWCVKNKKGWSPSERDEKIIEWSRGNITKENIEEVYKGYNKYANSNRTTDQVLDLSALVGWTK